MHKNRIIQQSFAVPFHYPIHFTRGVFDPSNPLFSEVLSAASEGTQPKVLFVIDEGVHNAHPDLGQKIQQYTKQYSSQIHQTGALIMVPGGESCKNDSDQVEVVLRAIEAFGVDRHSFVVAIGGGAVLDMTGFAAAIAHRGVRLIRIPTTVLSQNDSGVGVKNSVNYFGKKNFLGTFDPPFAVINDSEFLSTLPLREWRSGIAEAIKVALIKDKDFFDQIEEDADRLNERSIPAMEEQIFRCAMLHAAHIRSGDPFEKGSARPLDFGHWAAHKLEQMTAYALRHGEAVAIGIALDSAYSYLKGMLTEPEFNRIILLIARLGFDLYIPELTPQPNKHTQHTSVIDGLQEFQEHLGGELTITLLKQIGEGVEVHEMDIPILLRAINLLREQSDSIQETRNLKSS